MNFKTLVCIVGIFSEIASYQIIWTYLCNDGYCQKKRFSNETEATSLSSCQIFCSKYLGLWPKPRGRMIFNYSASKINVNSTKITLLCVNMEATIMPLVNEAQKRLRKVLKLKGPEEDPDCGGKDLNINLKIGNPTTMSGYNQKEDYNLKVCSDNDDFVLVEISAENYFGARNGLETLSQLVYFDDIRNEFQIADTVNIEDAPAYSHRGILLDTARNYISVNAIKRTIDGMAASKLNVFHWHITDTQSFPYVIESLPELSILGAYSCKKVYTKKDINEIVEYARVRGVYVLPEFDAPAHVGEGWQNTGFLTCFNKKPWNFYCDEPPCGQLNPIDKGVYDVLEKIYEDIVQNFDLDIFHMGGSDVSIECWKSEPKIIDWMEEHKLPVDEVGFMKLWRKFRKEALKRFNKQCNRTIPIILWTSTLTDEMNLKCLKNDTYVIQVLTSKNDATNQRLLENGFRIILSNYDSLYLDCGFENWVKGCNNNRSLPYNAWQKIYENKPSDISCKFKHLILGSEVTLWTEQADESSIDTRLWPRAAALAERLWSDPKSSYRVAEDRFVIHRNRLIELKIRADSVVPEWCIRNQGSCAKDGPKNG